MWRWTLNVNGLGGDRAAVTVGNEVFVFGLPRPFVNNSDQVEVHVFNTVSLRWRRLSPVTTRGEVPSSLCGRTAVLIENIVYIWGGVEEQHYSALYAFDVDAHIWFKPQVSGTVPESRDSHQACVLGKVMIIYGGLIWTGFYGSPANDMYKLDTSTMVWSLIHTTGTSPPASSHHSSTIIGTKMFVFGGMGLNYNTIRVFDTETNTWMNTPSTHPLPEGRWNHSAFAYNGEMYIFGGSAVVIGGQRHFSDVWKFSPATFSWKRVEPKGNGPICSGDRMCCCMVGNRMIFLGRHISLPANNGYNIISSDLYVLDFSPSLKTLCKQAVIQYGPDRSELPHNIRWELAGMTRNSN